MKSLCTRPDLDFVWCFFKQIEGPDAILWLAGRLELRPKLWMTRWFYIFLCSGFLSHNCGRCVGKEKTSKQALGWGYVCDLGKLQQIPSHRLTAAADISRSGTHEELCHSPAALHDHRQATSFPCFPSKIYPFCSPGWILFVLLCQCFTQHFVSAERDVLLVSIC